MTKVYLAIPYTGMQEESVYLANKICAYLMQQNYLVFNPIGHSHYLAAQEDLPTNWEFWAKHDLPMITWADIVIVIDVGEDKIQDSRGVQAEIQAALKQGKEIYLIDPTEYFIIQWRTEIDTTPAS